MLKKLNEMLDNCLKISVKVIKLGVIFTGFWRLKEGDLMPSKIKEKMSFKRVESEINQPKPHYMEISKDLPFDIVCDPTIEKPKIRVAPYIVSTVSASQPLLKTGKNWYFKRK